ncbi:uncharacterized protein LOC112639680 [Camponotus floridanus]|uniref:uncharacterized protein LOC112639680 n=1 Tax=Camponotus floridanus TaxID=104421 RepID=UPI000DC6BFD7|nr:uncharacterized protein LOC112639680 [Camponotus floridanus]
MESNVDVNVDELQDDVFEYAGIVEISIGDALKSDEREEWKDTIFSEIKSLVKSDMFKIIKRSKVWSKAICSKSLKGNDDNLVVNLYKQAETSEVKKRPTRLVAKGYRQKYGVDYQTFAPVVRLQTIRLLCALGVELEYTSDKVAKWHHHVPSELYQGLLKWFENFNPVNTPIEVGCKLKVRDIKDDEEQDIQMQNRENVRSIDDLSPDTSFSLEALELPGNQNSKSLRYRPQKLNTWGYQKQQRKLYTSQESLTNLS